MLLTVTAALLGLATGSFLNVVVLRMPEGRSVVTPRSACPGCAHPLGALENLPVVSWLALGGRCRWCGVRISWQYPAVEAFTAATFVVLALRVPPALLPAALWVASCAIAAAAVDLRTLRLPNALTAALAAGGAAGVLAASALSGEWSRLPTALSGAAAVFAALAALHLATPRGFGAGDVKFAAGLALPVGWLGFGPLAVALGLAFASGAIVGVAALAAMPSLRRSRRLPFGPFLAAGFVAALAAGPQLWAVYLGVAGFH